MIQGVKGGRGIKLRDNSENSALIQRDFKRIHRESSHNARSDTKTRNSLYALNTHMKVMNLEHQRKVSVSDLRTYGKSTSSFGIGLRKKLISHN